MNCPICGAENAPDTKFCVGCGSALAQAAPAPVANPYAEPAPTSTPAPAGNGAKKLPVKGILFGVIGVVAAILVITLISSLFSGNGFVTVDTYPALRVVEEGEYAVVVGKKALKPTIKAESIEDSDRSLDYSKLAFVTDEGDLYVVSGKKVKQIKDAEDVKFVYMSSNGKSMVYASQGEDDECYTLYLAKVSNGKATKITDDATGRGIKISPDGKSVTYYKDGGDEDPDSLMYFKGKKSTEICDDENTSVYGLSNGGKQIYVSITGEDGETDLYSFNAKGKKTKIGSYTGGIAFNKDYTQAMYRDEDGKTFISLKGKEGKKVRNDSLSMVLPHNATTKSNAYPVSSLYNHVYENGEGDIYLIKKNKDIKLTGKASNLTLDDSGKYLYYVHDGEELKCLKISQGDKASEKAKVIIDDDFSDYVVTSNRKYVYYYDGEDLMSVNGKKGGNPKEITDELNASAGLAISRKDVLYYVVDDELFAVSNGKKGKKVLGDVEYVGGVPYGDVYAEADSKLFFANGTGKPKQILEFDED